MTTILESVPPSVELKRGGRHFGRPSQTVQERFRQDPPPEIGMIFVEDVVAQSAIMALTEKATRSQIIEAYANDICIIAERREEADTFMFRVLACAMEHHNVHTVTNPFCRNEFLLPTTLLFSIIVTDSAFFVNEAIEQFSLLQYFNIRIRL